MQPASLASGPSRVRVASVRRLTRRLGDRVSSVSRAFRGLRAYSGDSTVDVPVWEYVFLRRSVVRDRIQSRWFQDLLSSYNLVVEENVHLLAENATALTNFASTFLVSGDKAGRGSLSPRHEGADSGFSGSSRNASGDMSSLGPPGPGEAHKPGIREPGAHATAVKGVAAHEETKSGEVDSARLLIGALEAQLGETSRRMVAAEESVIALNEKLERATKLLDEKTVESDVFRRLVGEREEELVDRETELAEAKKACAFLQNERRQLQQTLQVAQQEVMEKALENERYLRELLKYKEAEATRLNEMQQLYVSIMEKQHKTHQPDTTGAGGGEGEGAHGAVLTGLDMPEIPGQQDQTVPSKDRHGAGSLFLQVCTEELSACGVGEGAEIVVSGLSGQDGANHCGRGSRERGGAGINPLVHLLSLSGWRRAKAPSAAQRSASGERMSVYPPQFSAASSRVVSDRSQPTAGDVSSPSAAAVGTAGLEKQFRGLEHSTARGDVSAKSESQSSRTPTTFENGMIEDRRRGLDLCRPPTRVQKCLLAHRGSVHACCAVPRMWGADIWTHPRNPLADEESGYAHHELLLTCGQDGFLALVDATSPALLYSFLVSPAKAPLLCVDASNDQRVAVVAAGDVTLYTVDACSQRVTSTLKGHSGRITACGFLRSAASFCQSHTAGSGGGIGDIDALMTGAGGANSASVWSCSLDRTVRLWDARRSACVKTTSLHSAITMGAASSDGEWLATSHQNGSVSLVNVRAEKCERVASLQLHEEAATGVAFDPSGRLVATQGKDKQLKIVDVRMWKELMTLLHIEMRYNIPQASPVFSSGDSAFVAAAAGPHVCCWTLKSGRLDREKVDASGRCYGGGPYWEELEASERASRGCERESGMRPSHLRDVRRDRMTDTQPDVVLRSQMTDVTCLNWQLHRGLVTGGKDGSVMLWEHE
ncbi:putative WD-repeat protein [Neospora caninum Liverpool]|uniref:Putative WD-repeat protein n=1 Tax=Neospora caninum (strain Liverpool) TaxID=572307 RepID=F0VJX0_NEOCL|nr:putative WD-repeat protein [Neospora caninum Liverpool]CBZ54032.1 putative WD-repeat protein [Neospora caninum Liverpool]CEL68036.1 TPA: WD-repeat protein, putative [Neospora caninum Liverpool]|eukprot:XP_003884063.1 putative WD-repeat protein [Neospora caninum Liverpool]